MVKNEYAKAYMKDKSITVIKDQVKDMLYLIKTRRKLNSISDTIKYLCDVEKDLLKNNMIHDYSVCEDCDEKSDVDNAGKYHNEVDKNANCFGCFRQKHKIKIVQNETTDAHPSINEQKDNKDETTDNQDNQDNYSEKLAKIMDISLDH